MRRRALLVGGATLFAGCSALSDGERAPETTTGRPESSATPTPTLPLTATDPAENVDLARGITVRNELAEPRFTTVVVEAGDRTVYTESDTVPPGEAWHHEELVARPGIYRVIVETAANGRAVHGWIVGGGWNDRTLFARLTADGVLTEQSGVCAPDCPPLPARGQSVELPREDITDPGYEVAGAVIVQNTGTERAPASLRVVDGGRQLIDYAYEIPPGVQVVVPVVQAAGAYDLSVGAETERVERTWHVPEERFPRFRLNAGGVATSCRVGATRVRRVGNSGEGARTVGVSLRTESGAGASETVRLGPNEDRAVSVRVPPGRTTLVVFVDGERRLTANWTVCPGGPLRVVVVGGTVFVRNDNRVVASAFAD